MKYKYNTSSFLSHCNASSIVSKPHIFLKGIPSFQSSGSWVSFSTDSGLLTFELSVASIHGRACSRSFHSKYDGLRVCSLSFSVRAFTLSRSSISPSELLSAPSSLNSITVLLSFQLGETCDCSDMCTVCLIMCTSD